MIQMCFPTVFWKYVNPICGGISQLIQDGLLTKEVLEPFSRKKYYPEHIMKILYKAIAVYKKDKKTKEVVDYFSDN